MIIDLRDGQPPPALAHPDPTTRRKAFEDWAADIARNAQERNQ